MNTLNSYNFVQAVLRNKKPFKVISPVGEIRYVLSESVDKCLSRFKKWSVQPITYKEYLESKDILEMDVRK